MRLVSHRRRGQGAESDTLAGIGRKNARQNDERTKTEPRSNHAKTTTGQVHLNQGTKQRIVGTLVLLALALIFLPIIFDGEGSYQTPLTSRIPEPPVISLLPTPEPVRPVILADSDAINLPDTEPTPPDATVPDVDASSTDTDTAAAPELPSEETVEPAETQSVAIVESQPVFTREVPTLDASGLPEGWSVRLGSFSDSANATALLGRLQAAGYRAYSRQVSTAQAPMTAVYVGPWLDRALVNDYQTRLQDEFQLSGMVVRYEIDPLVD